MRSCAWLICLAACGRIGFDPAASVDASPPVGDPLISVDPRTLPPFGAPQLVTLSDPGFEDDDPCLTRDQLEIFFDSTRDGDNDLFTARRASITEPWGPAVAIAELNTSRFEEHPQISGDGLTLYFTASRAGEEAKLWRATRADRSSPFGPRSEVDTLNSTEEEAMGSVDARDLVMVFSSRRGGLNTDDLYESRRASTAAPWGAPVAITDLNTPTYDRAAHLDDLGLVMYYERNALAYLRWTRRASLDAPWDPPTDLDEINMGGDEYSDPWLSPDLRTIYYTVGRGVGDKDIYMATR